MPGESTFILTLAALSLAAAAIAIFPGSLGVLALTHKFTARPAGAFFTYVVAVPIYILGVLLLGISVCLAYARDTSFVSAGMAVALFAGISIFGFLMHTGFMFKPVRTPEYISPDEAIKQFGPQEEVVGVLDRRGRPFAYVVRLARRPHIVYQTESDSPFIMSHCILSHSSMAYELNERFSPDRIFISSVIANNLVFYDRTSHCTVQQIYNRTTDQAHALSCLPTVMTSLAAWQHLYPDSKVWVRPKEWRDTFYLKLLARASIIDPKSPDLVYPLMHDPDPRLPLKVSVMGVHINGEAKAYTEDIFREQHAIEDSVGGEPIVFFASKDGCYIQLFSRRLEKGETLSFAPDGDDRFADQQTSSKWDLTGACLAGELKGKRLKPLAHYNKIFWCVWADFYPSTSVYESSRATTSRS